ncbi:MAG TPA: hypothetical protein VGQ26_01910, partial [Streptosporangiaceae bacterium]|nr:hypothetical protein [Streptosporangiaceae bacterium]
MPCSARRASPFNAETWKASKDRDYALKKARIEHLYAIADGEVIPEPGEPEVIFCVDEFGPLNLQPHPGRQWAAVSGKTPSRPQAVRAGGDGRDGERVVLREQGQQDDGVGPGERGDGYGPAVGVDLLRQGSRP